MTLEELMKAATPRVKALEWEDFDGRGAAAVAMLCAKYLITKWSDGRFEVSVSAPGYGTGFDGDRWHGSLDDAKAAAQADYDARILSALEPAPDLAAALVDAEKAFTLRKVYDETPTDRGGKNGPKGRAWQAFLDAEASALARIRELTGGNDE